MDSPLRLVLIIDTGLEMGCLWGRSGSYLEYTKLVLVNWVTTREYWTELSAKHQLVKLILVDGGKPPPKKEINKYSKWEIAFESHSFIPLTDEHGTAARDFVAALAGFEVFGESNLQTALCSMDYYINQTEPAADSGPYFDSTARGFSRGFDTRNSSSRSIIITITTTSGVESCLQVSKPHWKQSHNLIIFTSSEVDCWGSRPRKAVKSQTSAIEQLAIKSGGTINELSGDCGTANPLTTLLCDVMSNYSLSLTFSISFSQGESEATVRYESNNSSKFPLPRPAALSPSDNLPQYFVIPGIPERLSEYLSLPNDTYESEEKSLYGIQPGCVSTSPESPPFAVLLPGKLIVLPFDFLQIYEAINCKGAPKEVFAEMVDVMPKCYDFEGSVMLKLLCQQFKGQPGDDAASQAVRESVNHARRSASIVTNRKRRLPQPELEIIDKSEETPSRWWDLQHLEYTQRLAHLRNDQTEVVTKSRKVKLDQKIPFYKKSHLTTYQEALLATMTSESVSTSVEVMGPVPRAHFISMELAAHTAAHQKEHNRSVSIMSDTSYLPRTQFPAPLRVLPSTKLPPWFVTSERVTDSSKFKKLKQSAAIRLGFDSPVVPQSVPIADDVIEISQSDFMADSKKAI